MFPRETLAEIRQTAKIPQLASVNVAVRRRSALALKLVKLPCPLAPFRGVAIACPSGLLRKLSRGLVPLPGTTPRAWGHALAGRGRLSRPGSGQLSQAVGRWSSRQFATAQTLALVASIDSTAAATFLASPVSPSANHLLRINRLRTSWPIGIVMQNSPRACRARRRRCLSRFLSKL
jgi:hypothetical protein